MGLIDFLNIYNLPAYLFDAFAGPSSPIIEELTPIFNGLNVSWKSDVTSKQDKYAVVYIRNDTGNFYFIDWILLCCSYHQDCHDLLDGWWIIDVLFFFFSFRLVTQVNSELVKCTNRVSC